LPVKYAGEVVVLKIVMPGPKSARTRLCSSAAFRAGP